MTSSVPRPQLVDVANLPDYPIGREERVGAHFFMMWEHNRWLNSTLRMSASLEVRAAALDLFFIAQNQTPIGTLPDDDVILARHVGVDLARWQDMRARKPGPLHNWHPCRCDDEIRLMHPVVTEVAMNALSRRDARQVSADVRARKMRIARLREALVDHGLSASVIADDTLVGRLEDWLFETHRGNRKDVHYARAIAHAGREGWFNKAW
jgi:uncharacterized protein YdaU (DUF1376 family)